MIVLDLAFVRIKQVFRSKEFYFYVIGFPLFFLILFGFLSKSWTPVAQTLDLGFYSTDQPALDPLLNESLQLDNAFLNTLQSYVGENGKPAFNIQTYVSLEEMDTAIKGNKLNGGLELPSNFSAEVSAITRFYASMILVQELSKQFSNHPLESQNISGGIALLEPYFNITADLTIIFHGDVTLEASMRAYTTIWKVITVFMQNYTLNHTKVIWQELDSRFNYSFELNLSEENVRENSIDYNISLYNPVKAGAVKDLQREYYSKLIPAQIIQTIMMSSINALWILEVENTTGILKRLKLTRLSATQYLGSILLAFMLIGLLQGIAFLIISAILGFFSFQVLPIVWIFLLGAMVGLGFISATIAILVGAFIHARIATPILVLLNSTLQMFIAEYFFTLPTLVHFAGKDFTWFDILPIRPPFLVMKNGLLLSPGQGVTSLLFDMFLTILWGILIFAIGVFFFNKYKLQYAEKE
ncbi:MAG: ABC transporter permease [Candidatus Heimdallarchaeaceae archaeon]